MPAASSAAEGRVAAAVGLELGCRLVAAAAFAGPSRGSHSAASKLDLDVGPTCTFAGAVTAGRLLVELCSSLAGFKAAFRLESPDSFVARSRFGPSRRFVVGPASRLRITGRPFGGPLSARTAVCAS